MSIFYLGQNAPYIFSGYREPGVRFYCDGKSKSRRKLADGVDRMKFFHVHCSALRFRCPHGLRQDFLHSP